MSYPSSLGVPPPLPRCHGQRIKRGDDATLWSLSWNDAFFRYPEQLCKNNPPCSTSQKHQLFVMLFTSWSGNRGWERNSHHVLQPKRTGARKGKQKCCQIKKSSNRMIMMISPKDTEFFLQKMQPPRTGRWSDGCFLLWKQAPWTKSSLKNQQPNSLELGNENLLLSIIAVGW